jgi:hypothetical protein
MTAPSRTGRHNYVRPVVRPLPRPAAGALSLATTW